MGYRARVDTSSPARPPARPAVDGWFTVDPPRLLGVRCTTCGTFAFPPRPGPCPDPTCAGDELAPVDLSPTGTLWSYTENHYAPPPPFPSREPFEPYAIAAVELADEGLVVLGQVVAGVGAADLRVGQPMRVAIQTLDTDDDGDRLVWAWAPDEPAAGEA
jgi:uncharacterized OB-fold protein